MGRPRKTVDPKRVIELAAKGHPMEQIAAFEDWSIRTLQTRFRTQCEKGGTLAAAQIRRKQFEKALAGNGDTTMLIWLGKQLLGQRDKHEVETNWPDRLGYGGLPVPQRETELGSTDKPN
jgi:hypothetical protein